MTSPSGRGSRSDAVDGDPVDASRWRRARAGGQVSSCRPGRAAVLCTRSADRHRRAAAVGGGGSVVSSLGS